MSRKHPRTPLTQISSVATHRSDAYGARSFTTMLFLFAWFSLSEITQFFIVRCVYGNVTKLVPNLFEFGIRFLFRGKQLGKFYLQALDGRELLNPQFVKCFLRCLVDDDVILVFLQKLFRVTGLPISDIHIPRLRIIHDLCFDDVDLGNTILSFCDFRRKLFFFLCQFGFAS